MIILKYDFLTEKKILLSHFNISEINVSFFIVNNEVIENFFIII